MIILRVCESVYLVDFDQVLLVDLLKSGTAEKEGRQNVDLQWKYELTKYLVVIQRIVELFGEVHLPFGCIFIDQGVAVKYFIVLILGGQSFIHPE